MRNLYFWDTTAGRFFIAVHGDRYLVVFKGENLGSYASARLAASDLAGGHTFSPGQRIDTAQLGIPEDINEWHQVPPSSAGSD